MDSEDQINEEGRECRLSEVPLRFQHEDMQGNAKKNDTVKEISKHLVEQERKTCGITSHQPTKINRVSTSGCPYTEIR